MQPTHSVAAGLDYIGISPILAYLYSIGRIRVTACIDKEVLSAFRTLASREGIIRALESSHAVAAVLADSGGFSEDELILINLSGRGDKDIFSVADALGDPDWQDFVRRRYGV